MKNVFVCLVMICSLLMAISACSNDFNLQLEPNLEVPEKPVIIQKKPAENRTDPSYEEEPEETVTEDIDQEEEEENDEDDGDIDYPDTDQEETDDNNEPEITEVVLPEFTDFYLFSKKEIRFNFTSAVKNVSCTFTPHQEIDSIQDGKTVIIYLKENLELQTEFLIELNVIDSWENSLSVEVPLFVNDWIPKIEINELRTEYSNPKVEFIEFKVKSAGDLQGLQLFIKYNDKKTYVYNFPNVDVTLGEYVVYHLRTLNSTCVNELGENLSESTGTDSCPTARDLWVSTSGKPLHKTDIVYLQDANGEIPDAIFMNVMPAETWCKDHAYFMEIMEKLFNKGAWKSADGNLPGLHDSVDTSNTTATRSISRYEGRENTHSAKDWYVTDTSGATPGMPNKINKK